MLLRACRHGAGVQHMPACEVRIRGKKQKAQRTQRGSTHAAKGVVMRGKNAAGNLVRHEQDMNEINRGGGRWIGPIPSQPKTFLPVL